MHDAIPQTASPPLQRPVEPPHIGTQRKTGYIWLAYSFFFIIDPILAHSRRLWIQSGILYAIFLCIYVGYMYARTRTTRYYLIAALYTLGLVSFPINGGASCFFIYCAAFLPFLVRSVPAVIGLFAAQAIGILIEGAIIHINPISMGAAILLSFVVGSTNIFIAQQKRSDDKLRLAHSEIEQLAAVAERERIARDLHDVLGHTLSVIVLKAELAGRLIQHDPHRATLEIADVERTARTALAEVRETIGGYRARGLSTEMEHARNTLSSAGVTLACESPIPQLPAQEETVLCLAVREAVTNIVRHARATHCSIRFTTTPAGRHTLLITDDGPHPVIHEGNGLRGMRERIQSLGGNLFLSTGPGLTLCIELPHRSSDSACTVI
jgi:two-component system, NarL family, sensor histidine kinase DesK